MLRQQIYVHATYSNEQPGNENDTETKSEKGVLKEFIFVSQTIRNVVKKEASKFQILELFSNYFNC